MIDDPRKEKFDASEMPEVLIISSDLGLSHFLNEGLVQHGFWTSVVASGFQALEVFRLRQFDLIILDATIGDLGAAELARRLKSSTATSSVRAQAPIVVIAGDNEELESAGIPTTLVASTLLPPLELDDVASILKSIL